jgi:hypothetical protein
MRIRSGAVLVTLAFLLTGEAPGQVFGPSGGTFRVNAATTSNQTEPAAAIDGHGRFFVCWSADDGDGSGVFGRRFSRTGTPIDAQDFLVNSTTAGFQHSSAAAGTGDGTFLAVWGKSADTGEVGVFGQRYESLLEAGGVFAALALTSSEPSLMPSVALDSSGNFVVSWNEIASVNAQLYDGTGTGIGGNFKVSQTDPGHYAHPVSGRAPSGDFVVVWPNNYQAIMGRRYNSAGAAVGGEFTINTFTGQLTDPSVAMSDSGFVVTWIRYATERNVKAQRFDANFQPVGGEFRVNTITTGSESHPSVGMDGSGGFVVAWTRFTGPGYTVVAQRYASGGSPLGGEIGVDANPNMARSDPSLAMASNGDFVVTWVHNTQAGFDIHGARYCHALAGNANGDGVIDIADVFYLINALFAGGPVPVQSGDADGNGTLDVSDVFYLINYLFAGGPSPACAP